MASSARMSSVPLSASDYAAVVCELRDLLLQRDEQLHQRDRMIETLASQLESLRHQILALRRAQFGASSEKLSGQAELFAEPVSLPTPPESETRSVTYERRAGGRPKLPAQLPRVRIDYDLSEEQKAGYRSIERIGEELSETLDYIPARLQVVQHVRAKYAVRALDGQAGVVTAAMPAQPLPKSNAGPGLLAHVLVSKYADHLPLNRIEKILRRHGAEIARQTLCDWVLGSTQLLERLYEALKAHVLAAPKIHADDTVIKLADRATNRSVQARLWAYLGAGSCPTPEGAWQTHPAAVIYEFTPDRKAEHPRRMLAGYQGYLQADAYTGFDALYRDGGIVEVACWAHCRRKFFDIAQAAPPDTRILAHEALDWIGQLYRVESEIRDKPPDERREIRQSESVPILNDIRQWLDGALRGVPPRSPTAQAIGYALGQWEALVRYTEDGMLDIDNNAVERAMRPVVLGRNNFLFVGSERGGRAAAIAYSLIETCKLHGVEPYAYLKAVLTRLPEHRVDRIAELLPFNFQPQG